MATSPILPGYPRSVSARDPALLAECRALQHAIEQHPTIASLRTSPQWPELNQRFERVFERIHRYASPAPAPDTLPGAPIKAVQWNIEHGNWYARIEEALLRHPAMSGADLVFLDEIDLGMARAGNRDVTAELSRALHLHGVWTPLFVETTIGRDDDAATAVSDRNEEGLFGIAVLSRWPIGAVRRVDLPSPEMIQYDYERMYGRHVALIVEVLRPGAPFVAVPTHLEVFRTRAHRAAQMQAIVAALEDEPRPVLMAGDFNTHTFDRGSRLAPLAGAATLLLTPAGPLRRRLRRPDRGRHREPLFDVMAQAGFTWEAFVDFEPTLQLRFARIDELRALAGPLTAVAERMLRSVEPRAQLRLDWFAGRGWRSARGVTVHGLSGRGGASDHAPIVVEVS